MCKLGSRVKVVGDCRLPLGTIAIVEAYSETVDEYYIRNEISDYKCWVKLEVIEPYDDRSNETGDIQKISWLGRIRNFFRH